MDGVTIRILFEPERLVEKRGRRRASLDRAEILAAHELQVPIALGLVIENLWSSWIDDFIHPGRIHEHDSQLGRSGIFFKTALLEPDPSVPLQTIGIVVDGGRVSKRSPQIMEISAKGELGCGGVAFYAAVPHCGATYEHGHDCELLEPHKKRPPRRAGAVHEQILLARVASFRGCPCRHRVLLSRWPHRTTMD